MKVVYRGVKWRDEYTTHEYENDGTSAEVSVVDVDTVMTSPMKNGGIVEGLMAENAELKEALRAENEVPEGCGKLVQSK